MNHNNVMKLRFAIFSLHLSSLISTATPGENVSTASLVDSLEAVMMSAAQCDKTTGGFDCGSCSFIHASQQWAHALLSQGAEREEEGWSTDEGMTGRWLGRASIVKREEIEGSTASQTGDSFCPIVTSSHSAGQKGRDSSVSRRLRSGAVYWRAS